MHTVDSVELRVLRQLAKRSKSDYGLFVRGATPQEYLARDIRPNEYSDAMSFANDWLLHNLLRKWKGWGTASNARDEAISTWKGAEAHCFYTNCRIRTLEPTLRGSALTLINEVREKIFSVLGPDVPYSWLEAHCRWSGGATFAHKRGCDAADKQETTFDVTPLAENQSRVTLYDPITAELHNSDCLRFEVVRGNRCVTVPKTAKTDRMIAAEPTANAFLQQGVGRFIRTRLKRFGVDLDDQTVNQEAAFRALVEELSTIDLKMASDTLSRSVVELLLPVEWFKYLNRIRSHYSRLDGKWYLLEKFSSMGNAFTFELESLIFWAIVKTVCPEGEIAVYGDDIICPSSNYSEVVAALNFFGFMVNETKSFTRGSRFFESCGKHFFDLEDVTPAYQKDQCRRLEDLIRFHNRLYRWGIRVNGLHLVKDSLAIIIAEAKKLHKKLPYIPVCQQDSGFLTADSSKYKVDKHGDFRCLQLLRVVDLGMKTSARHEQAGYAIKLRDPSYSNVGPDGHDRRRLRERRVLVTRRLWASGA